MKKKKSDSLIESDGEPHFYTVLYDRGPLWPDIDEEWKSLWKEAHTAQNVLKCG